MTSRELVLLAHEEGNQKVKSWVRKAGGIDALTEERAERIAKICKLKESKEHGPGRSGGETHGGQSLRKQDILG